MTSIRARLLAKALPLTGLKAIFSDEAKLKANVAKARAKKVAAPGKAIHRKFDVTETVKDGHPIFTLSPQSGSGRRILYIHGGAYVLDMQPGYWGLLGEMVHRTDAAVVAPCYPLTPEHDWQQSYDWMMAVYDELVAEVDADNIIIMGDSAGAGFALGLTQILRDQGKAMPHKMVLLSPWLDVSMTDPMQPALAKKDRILGIDGLRAAGRWWAGESGEVGAPPVSPLFGRLDDLPPIAVFTGTFDLLWPDARKFKEKAEAADLFLNYFEFPAMQHVWMLFPIPEAKKARQQIAAFINADLEANAK
ncbi:alpha/beta hydrolase fold domain-containing protein [Parasphingorhabdus cellanae]|uniref:Alpha/beta hydrolase n=1 Tax=Parasphingorhabdus cellanae TaxID=2806553 RepID=A0ABX7T553_9SPHN|nr:alpha/beta hydrolase [Parasphingorhabdus cellanae]QTD56719.1 alpha/beta hydrolase [Parasphingorhabdus cellanae]